MKIKHVTNVNPSTTSYCLAIKPCFSGRTLMYNFPHLPRGRFAKRTFVTCSITAINHGAACSTNRLEDNLEIT